MSNIVRAIFGGSKTTRSRRLWKIDRGMLLQFVDLNLPTAYQVHFANEPSSGQAKVVTATSDTVEIPYEYLQTGADVYAWVYLTPEDGVGYTEYMVTIPVYARPDVTDEEPTPTQQSALDTAISALNSGVESVQAAVAGVQDSIDTALQVAKDSGEFDGYTPVKGVDYFDGEKGDTGDTGETGNGIATAVLNADYTLTLTYTDGTTWTSGSIRGERGDKGETGADGYSPAATVTQTETGATVTVTDKTGTTTAEISNGQDGTTFTPAVSAEGVISWTNDGGKTNPQPVNIKGPQGDDYILTTTDKEEIAQQAAVSLAPALDEKAPVIYCEASGAIASFNDGADDLPVQDLVVQIEPVQAGSGDPSPDNVRPITGCTGAKVARCGSNLWKFDSSFAPTGYKVLLNRVPFDLKAGTYTFSAIPDIESDSIVLFGYHADGTRTEIARLLSSTIRKSATTIISKDVVSLYFVSNAAGTISDIQLELGSFATDYEPYQCETYDIQFPTEAGTVYGGSLDVTTGVLTVDRAQIASYAGETLPSTWISDRDVYSTGVTPTTGAQVVYELATPQTYQLTSTEIRTLLGENNIWADTGDTTVTYCADTKMFVEQNAASESAVAAKYTKPSTGIPASDLASAVQTSLGKADTALQSAPVTSVNGSTGAVVLSIPSTAADVGAIAAPASPATGAFLVWSGSAWTAQTLSTWQGGSY